MSSKIKCLVVDDEPLAREGIAGYVKQVSFLDLVGTCDNAVSASVFLKENKVDLLFLDIQMPVLSGLDFIKTVSNPPKVIFTTAYANYAVQGFELDAVDYLLKPISFERFFKAVNKALDILSAVSEKVEADQEFFFVKTDKKFLKINFDEIIFIESIKDYVKIYTKTEKHLVLLNMKNILTYLPESKFMRIHKSFVVSKDKINSIEGNTIKLSDMEIPIGREYKDKVNEFLHNKLIKRSNFPNSSNES